MRIYAGNLSFDTRDGDLEQAFAAYGRVSSCQVIMDRETNRSKGFGFVEMPNDDEAKNAIEALNGTELQRRSIKVNEAKPRESRPRY